MTKKDKTHSELFVDDKEKLIKMKEYGGFASIAVVVKKLIEKCGDKI